MKRFLAVLTVILVAVGCSLERIHYHSGRYDHWIQTPGVITYIRSYHSFRTTPRHTVSYAYVVDDKTMEGQDDYGGRSSIYHVGQRVEVWIDPNAPEHCSLHKPYAELEPYVPFCLAAPIVLALILHKPKDRLL